MGRADGHQTYHIVNAELQLVLLLLLLPCQVVEQCVAWHWLAACEWEEHPWHHSGAGESTVFIENLDS